jgi:hypothetical protein
MDWSPARFYLPDTAYDVSQEILALLRKNNVKDVVVEWREAVPQWLAGPPLLRHASDRDATHYVRRFLTALLAVPLTTEDMEDDDSQGTLTLWFLENKTNDGKPSDKVYDLSNCHVLRKDTTVDYSLKGGAPKDHVRVCGMHRFQRGLDEITKAVADHVFFADIYAQEIARLQAQENQGPETAEDLEWNQRKLEDENKLSPASSASTTKQPNIGPISSCSATSATSNMLRKSGLTKVTHDTRQTGRFRG